MPRKNPSNAGRPGSRVPGTLYLVATPIGNLEDVTLRALRVLREVDLVAAEDTRQVRKLLSHYGIRQKVTSYHEHNEHTRTPELLAALRSGRSVALVSDAGTPVLSDPGYHLVRACAEAGVPVVPVPGPSAVVAALVASALPTDRFLFLGFPPRKQPARRRFFAEVRDVRATVVLFESPQRLEACLQDLLEVLGDRRAALCRELTKVHEEIRRGTVRELLESLQGRPALGEVTVVVEGARASLTEVGPVEGTLRQRLARGEALREAAAAVAREFGLPRSRVYRLGLSVGKAEGKPVDLFVYGTLKDPDLVRALTGKTFPSKPGVLADWRLVPPDRSPSAYPEIEPSSGDRVEGLLLRQVDPEALQALDRYEEGYVRRRVRVKVEGRAVEAEVYVPARCARAGRADRPEARGKPSGSVLEEM